MSDRVAANQPRRSVGPGRPSPDLERAAFLQRLSRMSAEERLEASRFEFTARQRTLWIARYRDEVPIVNDEYEHIALQLADLD